LLAAFAQHLQAGFQVSGFRCQRGKDVLPIKLSLFDIRFFKVFSVDHTGRFTTSGWADT
jgi:hypothetical protein